jgi:hypothetical protein
VTVRVNPTVVLSELIRQLSGAITARRQRNHAEETDPQVQLRQWKESWITGAQAKWAGTSAVRNPHQAGSRRAAAWEAGWRWAEQHPDRRHNSVARFAHPHRRSTDNSGHLVRRATAGAAGLSALTLAGWLWQMRRRGNGRAGKRATDPR